MKLDLLFSRSAHILREIIAHPYNQGLRNGSLSHKAFDFYVKHDALYLRDYATGLTTIAHKFPSDSVYRAQFMSLATETIAYEIMLNKQWLQPERSDSFFSTPSYKPLIKTPVVRRYTEYLLKMAENPELAVAVSAFFACQYSYFILGQEMKGDAPVSDLRLQSWKESFSEKNFVGTTNALMETLSILIADISCPKRQETVIKAFLSGLRFERGFYDVAFDKQNEPESRLVACL